MYLFLKGHRRRVWGKIRRILSLKNSACPYFGVCAVNVFHLFNLLSYDQPMFSWIKRYLPKGLYWRAALILVLPVFLLQIIVSFVFIQRHFEGVTEQLTGGVIDDLRLIEQSLANDALSDALKIATALGVRVVPVDTPFETETRRFYDLSGIIVLRELRTVQSVKAIDLPDDDFVTLGLNVRGQDYKITVLRKRVSASNPHQLIVNMVFSVFC